MFGYLDHFKPIYLFVLGVLIISLIFDWEEAGIWIALIASVIAIAATDRKREKIKIEIGKPYISREDLKISLEKIDSVEFRGMNDVSGDKVKERYSNIAGQFYIVNFKITNKSRFTWKNPTFTYRTPVGQRYLHDVIGEGGKIIYEEALPHTNYRIIRFSHYFASDDKDIFTLTNLPYINEGESLTIWFTLFLHSKLESFVINMSINCENAEGGTEDITIKPIELINNFAETTSVKKG